MILELDCGNSFIKWRVIFPGCSSPVCEGIAVDADAILHELAIRKVLTISRCRLVSVRSDAETESLKAALSELLQVDVAVASPAPLLGGVTNGYGEPERLGLDRWLAVVAAYNLCGGPCVVIDLGTAVTVDVVATNGKHLGGYIAPGLSLLRGQLLAHTRRVHYDREAGVRALDELSPGASTAEAVERGCLIMLRSYISTQLTLAASCLGGKFTVYLTGGDAMLASDLPGVVLAPDLVFSGLAIACP